MKASLSWILDHVDVPDRHDHRRDHRPADPDRAQAGGDREPGRDITGPLVIGRVLTKEPEPQKNGKTINWCTVDVGDANGTGEPQGIVCGAHNFEPGDLVVTVLPGGVLPGGFEIGARKTYGHLSAGMICSARELGLGDDHDGIIVLPADAGDARRGRASAARARRGDHRARDQPRPGVRPLDPRHRPRGPRLGGGCDAASATRRSATPRRPTTRATPSSSRTPRAARSSSPARSAASTRPRRRRTSWSDGSRPPGMRPISLAVDVTNYVMLETGRPIHGYDADKVRGALVVRRARDGERLRTLDGTDRVLDPADLVVTDDSGIIGLGGVMGGETTEISGVHDAESSSRRPTGTRRRCSAPGGATRSPPRPASATSAASTRPSARPRPTGSSSCSSSTAAAGPSPGVTVVGTPPAMPVSRSPATSPRACRAWTSPRSSSVECLRAVGCDVQASGTLSVTPPPVAPRPDRRAGLLRGGRPPRRLRPGPVGPPDARPPVAA